jgi:hypothetical protein
MPTVADLDPHMALGICLFCFALACCLWLRHGD